MSLRERMLAKKKGPVSTKTEPKSKPDPKPKPQKKASKKKTPAAPKTQHVENETQDFDHRTQPPAIPEPTSEIDQTPQVNTPKLKMVQYAILRVLADDYASRGINIIGPVKPQNPFQKDLIELLAFVSTKEGFDQLFINGIVEPTKYKGQYKINKNTW